MSYVCAHLNQYALKVYTVARILITFHAVRQSPIFPRGIPEKPFPGLLYSGKDAAQMTLLLIGIGYGYPPAGTFNHY